MHAIRSLEVKAWMYLRLSGILLVPLVWLHAIINTLLVPPAEMGLALVNQRWNSLTWRTYDALLLAFAFSHGVTGLRQILMDYAPTPLQRKVLTLASVIFWICLSVVGAVGLLVGPPK